MTLALIVNEPVEVLAVHAIEAVPEAVVYLCTGGAPACVTKVTVSPARGFPLASSSVNVAETGEPFEG